MLSIRPRQPLLLALLMALTMVGCGGGGSGSDTARSSTIGGATGVETSVSEMSVGDVLLPAFSSNTATIDFSGGDTDATYELILFSTATSASNRSFTVANENVDFDKSVEAALADDAEILIDDDHAPNSLQAETEQLLRLEEAQLVQEPWNGVDHKSLL